MKKETNNEQLILEAAEVEFLEKGYKNTLTTTIAKRAGVTHTMLHYYFRTKENLFRKVYQNKMLLLGNSLNQGLDENLSFEEAIRKLVESHFDFVRENPNLLNFILTETVNNEELKQIFLEEIRPIMLNSFGRIEKLLAEAVANGTIRPTKSFDLLTNISSINIMTFRILPFAKDFLTVNTPEYLENLINERKESNVQFILNALRV
ncbi:MAG: TetR/AcrR family transcriptional regulator [Bacteroidales bacterium]|nr:TetR/AcrR family transcriptional regulator [Bacteroidales bacterium]